MCQFLRHVTKLGHERVCYEILIKFSVVVVQTGCNVRWYTKHDANITKYCTRHRFSLITSTRNWKCDNKYANRCGMVTKILDLTLNKFHDTLLIVIWFTYIIALEIQFYRNGQHFGSFACALRLIMALAYDAKRPRLVAWRKKTQKHVCCTT